MASSGVVWDVLPVIFVLEILHITGAHGGGEVCRNRMDTFYCENGCCGDYKQERCCSMAGLIVGIIIGVALLIGIIGALIYCYCKKRARAGRNTNSVFPFGNIGRERPRNVPRGNITIIRAVDYNQGARGLDGQPLYPGYNVYDTTNNCKAPLPPSYDEVTNGAPPPYSYTGSGPRSHGINTVVQPAPYGAAPVS